MPFNANEVRNPWSDLPAHADFVLSGDERKITAFNTKKGPRSNLFLHLDMLPEPFIGDPNAPVVLLSNNPGVGEMAQHRKKAPFMTRMRQNLAHERSDYPFLYLDPEFSEIGRFWRSELKALLREFTRRLGDESNATRLVARSVVNLVFFPYPSKRFGHEEIVLSSQEYTFHLLREAIKRDATIVAMRSPKKWFRRVTEWQERKRLYCVDQFQVASISQKNCPDGFAHVVAAIERANAGNKDFGPMRKPFPQSYWISDGLLCAGCYPGDKDAATRDEKLCGLLKCGIRCVVSLMEDAESQRFAPYVTRLQELAAERGASVECLNLPIRDASAPSVPEMRRILDTVAASLKARIPTYVHCWGGHGRTGTVGACHLIQQGHTPQASITKLLELRRDLPKNHHPFEGDQEAFIRHWRLQ